MWVFYRYCIEKRYDVFFIKAVNWIDLSQQHKECMENGSKNLGYYLLLAGACYYHILIKYGFDLNDPLDIN